MHLSHRIITILVVCWIPFCCCSIKAIAAMAGGEDVAAVVKTSCCSSSDCDASETDSEENRNEGGGCAGCCDRFAPEDAGKDTLPEIDEVGTAPLMQPALPEFEDGFHPIGFLRTEVRPPDPPLNSLLGLRCKFQV